jgi:hypothetical protein
MEIPKQQVLSMIESRMGAGQAQAAADQLPDQVDHEQHAGLLSQFGIDPQELLGGGGGAANANSGADASGGAGTDPAA